MQGGVQGVQGGVACSDTHKETKTGYSMAAVTISVPAFEECHPSQNKIVPLLFPLTGFRVKFL